MQENPFAADSSPRPPIPLPEALPPGALPPPTAASSGWEHSPVVVRSWAYTWAFLGMWISALFGAFAISVQKMAVLLVSGVLFVLFLWQRKAIQRGANTAWTVQILLSVVGLVWFPVGTLIHGYILSQWFKPEVREWFNKG